MRRPTSAWTTAILGTALSATTLSAQQAPPAPGRAAASSPSPAAVLPTAPARGPRYLVHNGWDYLNIQEYERALSYFRQAEKRQAELTDGEKQDLRRGLDAARRGLRDAPDRSARSYAKGGAPRVPGSFAAAPAPSPAQGPGRVYAAEPVIRTSGTSIAPPARAYAAVPVPAPAPSSTASDLPALPTGPAIRDTGALALIASADVPPPTGVIEPLSLEPALPPLARPSANGAGEASSDQTSGSAESAPSAPPIPAAPEGLGEALPPLPEMPELPPAPPVSDAPSAPVSSVPVSTAPAPPPIAEPLPPLPELSDEPAPVPDARAPLSPAAERPVAVPELPASPPDTPAQVAPEPTPAPVSREVPKRTAPPEPVPAPPAEEAPALNPVPAVAPIPTPPAGPGTAAHRDAHREGSTLPPHLQREVERVAEKQDEELRRDLAQPRPVPGPDAPMAPPAGGPTASTSRLDISRAPSPTEARPIKAIPNPEEFVPMAKRDWSPNRKYWAAAAPCHLPLYFQDASLERYGHSVEQFAGPAGRFLTYRLDDPKQSNQRNQLLQPLFSIGLFAVQTALWPYNIIMDAPWEAEYDLGYYRPGDRVPCDVYYLPTTGVGPPLHGSRY